MSDDSTKNEEESLFLAEMRDVTPLKSDNKVKIKKPPKKPLKQAIANIDSFTIDDAFSDAEIIEECPDNLSFSRSGLQH
ncbi:MAG: hypothetical protein KJO03_07225, partial [Gammaproteobacteria bacterium]|nr:hypothetical protein [Gammaproteobacteria bacterium]